MKIMKLMAKVETIIVMGVVLPLVELKDMTNHCLVLLLQIWNH